MDVKHPDYDKLPECIKSMYTEAEYVYMGEVRRAKLIEQETEPEAFEDS